MNFKPTLWKSSISVISGVLVNYLLTGTIEVLCDCLCAEGVPCQCPCSQPKWIEFAFDPVPLAISLSIAILVYLIWSFIQKK